MERSGHEFGTIQLISCCAVSVVLLGSFKQVTGFLFHRERVNEMGHEGCCAECAMEIRVMSEKVKELHTMAFSLAEAMSKLGESPMGRGLFRTLGMKAPGAADK